MTLFFFFLTPFFFFLLATRGCNLSNLSHSGRVWGFQEEQRPPRATANVEDSFYQVYGAGAIKNHMYAASVRALINEGVRLSLAKNSFFSPD